MANPVVYTISEGVVTKIFSGAMNKSLHNITRDVKFLSTYRDAGETALSISEISSEGSLLFSEDGVNEVINLDEKADFYVFCPSGTGQIKVSEAPRRSSMPYAYDIAEGNIEGHAAFTKIGFAPSLTANANTDIWSYAGTQAVYLFPTAEMGMEVVGSNNTDDIGTSIKSGTSTGGSLTTLIDSVVDFTTATAVAVGDAVILDKSGASPEFGWVTAVAAHQLTIAGGFSRGGSGSGRAYVVLDKSATAGAHAVEINYLDGDYAEYREIVIMNGTTVVPTVKLDLFRINSFRVVAGGANGIPTGNLILRHIDNTPVYSFITAGFNRARNAMYTVPAGKVLYVTDIAAGYATSGSPNKEYARVTTRANIDPTSKFKTDGLFYPFTDVLVQNVTVPISLAMPTKLPEKTDIKLSVIGSANGVVISALRGWLEDES